MRTGRIFTNALPTTGDLGARQPEEKRPEERERERERELVVLGGWLQLSDWAPARH